MDLQERLQNVKSKLLRLKEKDQKLEMFGAGDDAYSGTKGHHYELNPVALEEDLAWMEEVIGAKFPEEYREFLKQVADGGAGPFWGMWQIGAALPAKDWFDQHPDFFKQPFPYTNADAERIISEKNQNADYVENSKGIPGAYLTLAVYGHDWDVIMPITGEQAGNMWFKRLDSADVSPIYAKTDDGYKVSTFLDWYEGWLDSCLAPGVIADDPEKAFAKPETETAISYQNRLLTKFPENALACINIVKLNLDSNKLKALPAEIRVFSKLEELSICWNELEALPEEIGDLVELKYLILKTNMIKTVPESIGKLRKLNELYLGFNGALQLPESLGDLEALEYLHLEYTGLSKLPESVKKLKKLKFLNISGNQFSDEEKEKWRKELPNTEIVF